MCGYAPRARAGRHPARIARGLLESTDVNIQVVVAVLTAIRRGWMEPGSASVRLVEVELGDPRCIGMHPGPSFGPYGVVDYLSLCMSV